MGIFDALTTAVAGLQAQSFALQNISGNIANSQTTGYKETDTQLRGSGLRRGREQQTAGGVIASSVATNTVQGTIQSTSVSDRHGHRGRRLLRGGAADRYRGQRADVSAASTTIRAPAISS